MRNNRLRAHSAQPRQGRPRERIRARGALRHRLRQGRGPARAGGVGRPGTEDLRRPRRDARGGAGPGHRGRRHRERRARAHRAGLHRRGRQRDNREARRDVDGRRRRDRAARRGARREGIGLPPEPLQRRRAPRPPSRGGGSLRAHVPRIGPREVEPGQGLLRPGPLEGHLGPGRRLPHEPVHPRRRPAALDDGRRGGLGLRPDPAALPRLPGGRGRGRGGAHVRGRVGGHRGGHLQRVPEKPRGDAVPVRRVRHGQARRDLDQRDRRLGFCRRARGRRWDGGAQRAHLHVYGNGHALLYADVADAIENDRAPYVDARAGRDALEVVLAIYKSQRTGLPVELPLEDFASTDMEGEF